MAKTPDQTDGQQLPEEATVFVSPESTAEQEAVAEEIVKRINAAFDSVGLTGTGKNNFEHYTGDRGEKKYVSKGIGRGKVDYTAIDRNGSTVAGTFSLDFLGHDDIIDSAGATYHLDEGEVHGREALELIDQVFPDLFPPRTIVEEFEA